MCGRRRVPFASACFACLLTTAETAKRSYWFYVAQRKAAKPSPRRTAQCIRGALSSRVEPQSSKQTCTMIPAAAKNLRTGASGG
eukprot:4657434-Amphidinium_carterae.1